MKPSTAIVAVFLAAALGYVTGVLGTVIQHYNESTFGASSRQFQYEWLTTPAIPGLLIAEICSGYDWRVDEAWSFRRDIRLWNAVFWSAATFAIVAPFTIDRFIRQISARAASRKLPGARTI